MPRLKSVMPFCMTLCEWANVCDVSCVTCLCVQMVKRQQRAFARANLSLQRVARNVWGASRDMWITERVAIILEMWHRYAVFRRCKRYGQGIPVFPDALPLWTAFVDNFQARKLRARMSAHYMPKVTYNLRCLLLLLLFSQ